MKQQKGARALTIRNLSRNDAKLEPAGRNSWKPWSRACCCQPSRSAIRSIALPPAACGRHDPGQRLGGLGHDRRAGGRIRPDAGGHRAEAAATGDLDITDVKGVLTISGAGPGVTIIDGQDLDRVFDVHSGAHLVLQDLTIRGGEAQDAGSLRPGSRIVTAATSSSRAATRRSTTSRSSTAKPRAHSGSNAVNATPATAGANGAGGGIYVAGGSLTLNQTRVSDSYAYGGYGGTGGSTALSGHRRRRRPGRQPRGRGRGDHHRGSRGKLHRQCRRRRRGRFGRHGRRFRRHGRQRLRRRPVPAGWLTQPGQHSGHG